MARDVRMRGFAARATVAEAWAWIDQTFKVSPATERVSLHAAHGRVAASDVISDMDVPPFDRAAMDGYAVQAAETIGATEYNPLALRVVGSVRPGESAQITVEPGTAVQIMTGAPIPCGANAIVPAEYAQERGGVVELSQTVGELKHIGRQGEDVRAGQTLVPCGRRLRPQDVAVLAAIGQPTLTVVRRPRVRLVVTGNELVLPGTPLMDNQIYEANSFLLQGLVPRDGGELVEIVRCRDQRDEIARALTAKGADVVLVSGGSSVGTEDHAPSLVSELGTLAIHGLAMRPSSPAGMGQIGSAAVFLLPGNPVSCLCAYDFFAGRALRRLAGLPAAWPYRRVQLPLFRKISSAVGRVDYCRVKVTPEGVEPLALSGASILSSTVRSDGFVIVPEDSEGAGPGTSVEVYLWDQTEKM